MDCVAHPPFVIAAAEHTGHRRDAQLFDVFTRVDVVFHIHNHLRLLTVNHELIGAGDAWAVEQRIDGKYRSPGFTVSNQKEVKSGNSSGVSVKVSIAVPRAESPY